MNSGWCAGCREALRWSCAVLVAALLLPVHGQACTTLSIRSDSGAVVNIMNMEFPENLDYTLNHIPAGIRFQGDDFDGMPQASWTSVRQVIGTGGKSDPQAIGAGINDAGLFVTALFLEEGTRYQALDEADFGKFIAPPLLPTYLLTQFETVEQVKQALASIKVAAVPAAGFYNVVPTYHWMVTDAARNSLTIEYTEGQLKIYDNPYNTLTNAPTFDFHLNNMRNYPFVSNQGLPPADSDADSTGVGFGTLGLPGDYTPTGRFVRAAFLAGQAEGSDNVIMQRAVELSNALVYPPGAARYRSAFSGRTVEQKTMYAFIANAETGQVLFRRYGDMSWIQRHFDDFAGSERITLEPLFDDWNGE